ncbi:SDR family oxidoreductase [Massilia sp. SR12]
MNKIAFVTGGSRGIGAAIVRRLAKDGATVAFTYQNSRAAADALASEITAAGGTAVALQVDAADASATRAAINGIAARFGRIDILVNNAGVLHLGDVSELTLEAFDQTIAVNVRGVFAATQAAVAHMQAGGRVINIGSTNADRMPFAGGSVYAMSKSALTGMVQGLARDLGPRGITINNVQPGPVDTDMNPANSDFAKGMHELMAIKRHARGEEIAGMVAYLASDEAGYVTGAGLNIDGGFAA